MFRYSITQWTHLSWLRLHFQATQKGDPVAVLKKQLDEREKQLAIEQEDASAAKNRLREMTKVNLITAYQLPVCDIQTRAPI